MARGGPRAGAGRPKGGRTRRTQEIAAKAADAGESPLEYMLRIMRDKEADPSRRDDMAKHAAPYIHPKLSAIDATVSGEVGLKVEIVRFGDSPSSE